MSGQMWVTCKHTEVFGSDLRTIKVEAATCLRCVRSFCPTKVRIVVGSFIPVVDAVPDKGLRMMKSGYCPLKPRAMSWCTAGRIYCKYNTVCSLAKKYPKQTLVIRIKEVQMFAVKEKKSAKGKEEGSPMPMYDTLDEVTARHDIAKVDTVFQATHQLVAQLEYTPRAQDGSRPKVRAVRGIENMVLIDSLGNEASYDSILEGRVKSLFIVTKALVPSVSLAKVEIPPLKNTRKSAAKK